MIGGKLRRASEAPRRPRAASADPAPALRAARPSVADVGGMVGGKHHLGRALEVMPRR